MKTVREFGYAYAQWLKEENQPGFVHQNDVTRDIPDGDATEMIKAGIENPDSREYWGGFNDAVCDADSGSYRIEENGANGWFVISVEGYKSECESKSEAIAEARRYAEDNRIVTRVIDNDNPNFPIYVETEE